MGKIIYDFREGLEPEKLIFKENTHRCKESIYWLLYLLLCWTYACGWYALFHWSYINYEDTAVWVIGITWCVFVFGFLINAFVNLQMNKKNKLLKKEKREKEEKQVYNEVMIRANNNDPNPNNGKFEKEDLGFNEIIPNNRI